MCKINKAKDYTFTLLAKREISGVSFSFPYKNKKQTVLQIAHGNKNHPFAHSKQLQNHKLGPKLVLLGINFLTFYKFTFIFCSNQYCKY